MSREWIVALSLAALAILSVWLSSLTGASVINETVGNQTNWFVDVHDGMGLGSGDSPQEAPDEEEDEDDNGDEEEASEITKKLNNWVELSDRVLIEINRTANSTLNNTSNTEDKKPINWTPIMLWGMVIVFLTALAGGAWYVYQIYFY